jgi:hypothetical protein
MSNSLNLTNISNWHFLMMFICLQNTGQSSIYNIFGTQTQLSSLGGLNTTTLTQISSAITSLSTINSALATKANYYRYIKYK